MRKAMQRHRKITEIKKKINIRAGKVIHRGLGGSVWADGCERGEVGGSRKSTGCEWRAEGKKKKCDLSAAELSQVASSSATQRI